MFTEMKGINFYSLGLHSFLCMKKPWSVFFLQPQAVWYSFSRVVVHTEACSGGRGAARSVCPGVHHTCTRAQAQQEAAGHT